ncbi:MAG: Flp family type IVb pilin [Desulfobacterales bacterium]
MMKVITGQRGAIAAEYALLAVLIAVAIVSGATALGEGVLGLFQRLLDSWP